MTRVVHIHKEKYDVYIGRSGKGQDGYFGNPYVIGKDGTREDVIMAYSIYFEQRINRDPEFRTRIEALRGETLGCFCTPQACHGDVIAEWLDNAGVVQ